MNISIIICSRNSDITSELKNNIRKTIGNIDYEIICIDNSNNRYSIFSAYDEGIKRAQYDYLCFMHEDIIFHSVNWGNICIQHLRSDEQIGLLGVLGGHYLSKYATGWCSSPFISGQLIQGLFVKGKYTTKMYVHTKYKDLGNNVVAIDGLWIFTRKSLFKESLKWDKNHFHGFHFYDLDISMQVLQAGYKIAIADILIEHKSPGYFNKAFWDSYLLFHEKWNSFLPVQSSRITPKNISEYDSLFVSQIYSYNTQILNLQSVLKKIGFKYLYKIYISIHKLFK